MKNEPFKIRPYKKELDYSYAFGAFAVYELIKARPEAVRAVYIRPGYTDADGIEGLCAANKIPFIYSDKLNAGQKENVHVLGVFGKYSSKISAGGPHVVLVNPGDMGNIGTIIRTMAGLNIRGLAIINPAADVFAPRCVRASMGALFRIDFQCFDSFEEYEDSFQEHSLFPFMTDGKIILTPESCPEKRLFSLIFGSEASGLPESFADGRESVKLLQSPLVDSLNLSVAAGIGMYIFAYKNGLITRQPHE